MNMIVVQIWLELDPNLMTTALFKFDLIDRQLSQMTSILKRWAYK